MKITKSQLKQFIKEELSKVLREGVLDSAADIQGMLRNIAYWMQENGIFSPKAGIEEWIKLAREEGESISPERERALYDMSDEIYNYME